MVSFLKKISILASLGLVVVLARVGFVTSALREVVLIEDRFQGLNQEKVIRPASYSFLPLRIIPGRIQLHRVELYPHNLEFTYKKPLEQSEILGLDESFYVRIKLYLLFRLDQSKIVELFKKLPEYNWQKLDAYLILRIRNAIEVKLRNLYASDKDLDALKANLLEWVQPDVLQKELNKEFLNDGIIFQSIIINEIYVPEPNRYRSMVNLGIDLIKKKLDRVNIVEEAKAQKKAREIYNSTDYERWERIAKLLNEYPSLRSFLAIDRLSDKVQVMVVPYNSWFGNNQDTNSFPPKSFYDSSEARTEKSMMDFFPFLKDAKEMKGKEDFTSSISPAPNAPSSSLNKKNTFTDLSPP